MRNNIEINRWWYSREQKEVSRRYPESTTCHVMVDGKWQEYTEWTTSLNGKCNWDDAVLIAESVNELEIMVNGIVQSR